MSYIRRLPTLLCLGIVALLGFSATALAANAAASSADSSSLLDLLRPIYDAITGKHYALAGALGLVGAVGLVKRYLGDRWSFLHTDVGGTLTTLLMAFGAAMASALAPGAHLDFAMVKGATLTALAAIGGYTALKKFIAPMLMPLVGKLPLWMQPIARLFLWLLDKPAQAASEQATAAGDAAVAAKPGEGISAVAGQPTDVN